MQAEEQLNSRDFLCCSINANACKDYMQHLKTLFYFHTMTPGKGYNRFSILFKF